MQTVTCAALVTAAGLGIRMGAGRPKQYLDLAGAPVLVRTLTVFEQHPLIERVVVTVPPGQEDFCQAAVIEPYSLGKIKAIVPGGETRQQSVYNGLETLSHTDIVVIHDGVRPLVSPRIITKTLDVAKTVGAAVACVPIRDTVKRKEGQYLFTMSRTDLWLAQTFKTGLILEAHRKAAEDGYSGTDDASLVERLGLPVEIVEDFRTNIKITAPEDLILAELLLADKSAGSVLR